ncbi:MAG: ribosome small subunit-dependent GTPase A [Bacteroidetes bacterium]|nr:ribosome small subunit-dependent GTPase A [Bacteroidota bacterium]
MDERTAPEFRGLGADGLRWYLDANTHLVPIAPDLILDGRVVSSSGLWSSVTLDDAAPGDPPLRARLPGRFRLDERIETNPLAVGDRVTLRGVEDGTAIVETIHPRTNALRRRAAGRRVGAEAVLAANVDRAWVVQSVDLPRLNPGLVDRFLVTCEREEIPAGIVVNKSDLLATDAALRAEVEAFETLYTGIGYPVLVVSTKTGDGLDAWRDALAGRLSVVAGASGVGKSSLLNAAAPNLGLRTQAVSDRTRKGTHTTTNAALHLLPSGGFVVDTPGVREFGVVDIPLDDLGFYFREFQPFIGDCRFQPCTHDHEPDCAVMNALDDGLISEQRYDSYLSILDSLRLGDRGR